MTRVKVAACFAAMAVLATAQQQSPLLAPAPALQLYQRTAQLIESTAITVPGLSRASAPLLDNVKQAIGRIQLTPNDANRTLDILQAARGYLALSDSMPKPEPFPEAGRRQFIELRESVDRVDAHFRALLESKERQLRSPDRDNVKRYAEVNERLTPATPGRVVFLGDSITDGWRLNEYFPGRDFVNRGISGQTTGQMLGRMKADVIDLKPKALLVLGGTNDIAREVSIKTIEDNLTMIADLAQAHGIKLLLATLLPVSDYHKAENPANERTKQRPPAQIREVNHWIESFCAQRDCIVVDYYSSLVNAAGFLPAERSDDGLHPNAQGYRIMAPTAVAAIDKALTPEPKPVEVVKGKKRKK